MNKDKLHTKAINLMERLDNKYNRSVVISLDEYFCEYEFTQEESDEIWELINLFYQYEK
jgi:hypothetical protein